MRKMLLTTILAAALAALGTTLAEPSPATVGEGEYGCCCAWCAFAGLCPVEPVAWLLSIDDVCALLDDDGSIVGFCIDDPDGTYLFRGLSWPERAVLISESYGIEPTVGSFIDFFCGIDMTTAP